jgi:serine protease inhibitor
MKKIQKFAILLVIIIAGISCSETKDCGCVPPPDLRPITATEQNVIESANDFSFDIFSRINAAEPDKNLFISPLSISTALSMTTNGTVGETKQGIKTTLHQTDMSDIEINEAYKSLATYLTTLDPKVIMQLANSNWYKDEYHIKENFKSILQEYYDAEVRAADFDNPDTKNLINGWIENKTNGKIKDMIDQIPADAVMYLINAIYLKATWQYQFEKNKTEPKNFTLANGEVVKTPMMYSEGVKANAYFHQDYQFVELPYGNGQFVFSIITPTKPGEIDDFITGLNVDKYKSLIDNADTGTFKVYLPKFKIEYKITLNDVLASMGMTQSFSDDADFSELFVENLSLFISRVLHQSFLEVDEEGTEAAAATVVEISLTSIGPGSQPSVIYIDKPFAFFIRERHSNAILFAGKLHNPLVGN